MLFAAVTEDVIQHDRLTQFDIVILEWFHQHNTVLGLKVFEAISFMGSPIFMLILGLIIAVILAVRHQWIPLATWAAALLGVGLLIGVLKAVIRRPRPLYAAVFKEPQSFSFPSGHAMGSLVVYGMIAYLLAKFWAERRAMQVILFASAFIISGAVGVSRLYLGVHYFSDIVGGYAVGSVWLATCITGLELERARQETFASKENRKAR